jgi:hypothetical protein
MAKLNSGTRIYGNLTVDTNLVVSGTTISTTSSTGAVTVAGGAGVAGNVYVGGLLTVTGNISSTGNIINTRITPRVQTTTSNATPTINTDLYDVFGLTAQAANITNVTVTGTPADGQKLLVYIVGTGTVTITWGASFESSTTLLPSTTSGTNRLDVGFVWNAATSKWRCLAYG